MKSYKDMVIKKIAEMPNERVLKVLIFMAGMEAEKHIDEEQRNAEQPRKPPKQTA